MGRKDHTILVHLDDPARTRQPGDQENSWNITFTQTTEVKMAAVGGFLTQRMDFTNDVFEAINFLDHVLRQTPSQEFVQIKRSFFTWDEQKSKQEIVNTMMLDDTLEFMRGVYASVRLCHVSCFIYTSDLFQGLT